MITTTEKKIWGIEYTEIYNPDLGLVWIPEIKNPFYYKDGFRVGLNEKFLREANNNKVDILMIKVKDKEIPMNTPTENEIKKMIKNKEYEEKKSKFENGLPMRIFYFDI